MEDNKAPMVVGARHTNNATNDVIDVGLSIPACFAENTEYAYNDTVTNINITDTACPGCLTVLKPGVLGSPL